MKKVFPPDVVFCPEKKTKEQLNAFFKSVSPGIYIWKTYPHRPPPSNFFISGSYFYVVSENIWFDLGLGGTEGQISKKPRGGHDPANGGKFVNSTKEQFSIRKGLVLEFDCSPP